MRWRTVTASYSNPEPCWAVAPSLHNAPGLLERFRRGSRDAMEAVYWAYAPRVELWVRRGFRIKYGVRVPGVRSDDLEDLVQEIFAKAFSDKARLSFDGAVRGFGGSGPFLVVDIGGGSTEFVVGSTSVSAAISVDVGCVRMTERFLHSDPPTPGEVAAASVEISATDFNDLARQMGA